MRRSIFFALLLCLPACRTTPVKSSSGSSASTRRVPSPFSKEADRINSQRSVSLSSHQHRVRKGETLYGIARRYGVSVHDLMAANHIRNPNALRVGQVLRIPSVGVKIVPRSRPPGGFHVESRFCWPVRGTIVKYFGSRKNGVRATGIDIRAAYGAPVVAAKSGVVDFVSNDFPGWGKVVVIDHRDGYRTWYANNSVILVKKDEWVKQGQTIAKIGSTGRTQKAQLNFRVLKHSKPIDPLSVLPRR